MIIRLLMLFSFLVTSIGIKNVHSLTDTQDTRMLLRLKDGWQNAPPNWNSSNDPCGTPWLGITCNNSRVTAIQLPDMGLIGTLSSAIGGLSELNFLELYSNPGLRGPLPPELGKLTKLNILNLANCSFNGLIPRALGNLSGLTFLDLGTNYLSGWIPESLGKLSNLNWLGLENNALMGPLPVSSTSSPGLDLLKKATHFHLSNNGLYGEIPSNLFSSDMKLKHLFLDNNQLEESIPPTIGLVQTLQVIRLDENFLAGTVPQNLKNLTNLIELKLAKNMLSGALPDLGGMSSLQLVDLSNNCFAQSEAPSWFSSLQSLTTLIIEYGPLKGTLGPDIFSLPQIQQVLLRNNDINTVLDINKSGSQLQLVDLQNNNISSAIFGFPYYGNTLLLRGNPLCNSTLNGTIYC